MTKFQPNPNIHLRNVGYEYQIINGNNVVTFTGVEVCSFLHGGRGKEMDKWTFRRSRGVVDGYTCFIGYSSKYPDGLIMTANGWICNLFNYYTKTL